MGHQIPTNDLLLIRKAVIETGRVLRSLFNSDEERLYKYLQDNVAGHQSLGIDLLAEKTFVENLNHHKIRGIVVSEENGEIELKANEGIYYTFIIDPLDGSTNYRRGIPFNSISVAYAPKKGPISLKELRYGLVYDFNTKNLYEVRDSEVFFNDEPRCARRTGAPRTICYYYYSDTEVTKRLLHFEQEFRIRTLGCVSLELIHVAMGGFDGFIDIRGGLGSYDFAVAAKIITLFGGHISIFEEDTKCPRLIDPDDIDIKDIRKGYLIVASFDQRFHEEILAKITPTQKIKNKN